MISFLITNEDVSKRLDVFLIEKYPDFSRSHIQNLIKNEDVIVERNGKKIEKLKTGEKLKNSDKVFIEFKQPQKIDLSPEDINVEIVYEDDDLAVINKPQGLVVHPSQSTKSGTLVNALLYKLSNLSGINGNLRPGIVHRLDKNTCGLMLVAKNDFAHVSLAKQIETKICHRIYEAIIDGRFKEPEGEVITKIERDKKDRKKMAVSNSGKVAITKYKTLEFFKDYSLVEFELKTGRTHQIRVHCKFLHHPIIGDDVYGGSNKFKLAGQCLCAKKIVFFHPKTNEKMEFEIPLPPFFENILTSLRKNNAE